MAVKALSFRDVIDDATVKAFMKEFGWPPRPTVFGEGVSPPIHPGDIKWTWERVNPADPDSAELHRFELGRKITAVPAGEQQPSVEPREVPGSGYARDHGPHAWDDRVGDFCVRCGLARMLVEDYAPPCGYSVTARDALIDLMLKRNAELAGKAAKKERALAESLRTTTKTFAQMLRRANQNYELSEQARDQLRSRVSILEEDNARLKTELDRHPWARRMVE